MGRYDFFYSWVVWYLLHCCLFINDTKYAEACWYLDKDMMLVCAMCANFYATGTDFCDAGWLTRRKECVNYASLSCLGYGDYGQALLCCNIPRNLPGRLRTCGMKRAPHLPGSCFSLSPAFISPKEIMSLLLLTPNWIIEYLFEQWFVIERCAERALFAQRESFELPTTILRLVSPPALKQCVISSGAALHLIRLVIPFVRVISTQ